MINSNDDLNRVTNLDYLLDLAKGNMLFIREMIDTFLAENVKELDSLEKAIEGKDFEAIRQASHLLQSSIPFVGLDKMIGKEVYEIEEISSNKTEIKKIESLFCKVKEVCKKARQELSKQEYQSQNA